MPSLFAGPTMGHAGITIRGSHSWSPDHGQFESLMRPFQSQSSSSLSSFFSAFHPLPEPASPVALALWTTPELKSLASRSCVVNVSWVYPRPSKPTIRSTLTPSMKAKTHGSTWTLSFVTRKGAFSTFIFKNLVSKCFFARDYCQLANAALM